MSHPVVPGTAATAPSTRRTTGTGGRLIGVGVGPGDPGLLTRKAMEVLTAADRVVAPVTAGAEPGRAEVVVTEALPGLAITRLPFDMTPDTATGPGGGSGADARAESHAAAARALLPWLEAGEHVAFVTLGDPNVYSTFPALVDALRLLGADVPVETVPGITAFQDLASRSGTVLLDGTGSLSLVTALDGPSHVAEALRDPDRTIVVYKGGRHVPAIARLLAAHGRLEGAVLGELLGLPGERVAPLAAGARPASYLATVIVPPVSPPPTRPSVPSAPGEGAADPGHPQP